MTNKQLTTLLLALSVVLILSIFYFGGSKFINFDLSKVYDFRDISEENLPSVYGYITSILGKVVMPFAIVLAMEKRRWFVVVILSCLSILLFGLTSHKAPLFYPSIVLVIYWAAKSNKLTINFLIMLLFISLLSVIDLSINMDEKCGIVGWLGNLWVRRSFFVPSQINSYYIDFFSSHERYLWSASKLTLGLIEPPYSVQLPYLIGEKYFYNDKIGANTGWIGSGYANAGLIGVYIYSVLIGVYFSFLDSCASRINARMVIAVSAISVIIMLQSADFTTMFLTHGLIVLVFLLSKAPKDRNIAKAKPCAE